ncbi:hypothetical protein Aduo_001659 [Ancylostoma duodenale]
MSWGTHAFRSWNVVKYVDLRTKQSRILMEPGVMVNLDRDSRLLTVANGSAIIEQVPLSQHPLSVLYRDTAVVFTLTSPSLFIKFRIRLSSIADRCSLCLALSEFVPVQESFPAQKGPNSRGYVDHASFSQNLNTSSCNSQTCVSGFSDTCNTSSTQLSTCKSEYHVSSPSDFHTVLTQRKLSQEIFPNSQQYSNSNSSPFHSHSPFSPLPSQPTFSPLPPPPKRLCTREEGSQTDCEDLWDSSPERIKAELSRLLKTTSFHSLVQVIQQLLPTLQPPAGVNDA